MKKALRITGIILISIFLFFLSIYIIHQIKLKSEKKYLVPIGKMVEVDGKKMSIYTEGQGKKTIVFLSGSGTSSPILDFKSLYSLLSKNYRIVVIEKFGYGFSEISNFDKDLDTILENYREALKKTDITGPYILCPHSMSGIESLYWAQKYPNEVSAIVGLDMALPQAYEDMKINTGMMKIIHFAAKIGITRLGNFWKGAAVLEGTLTQEEKNIYKAVFYTRTLTDDMLYEAENIKESAKRVKDIQLVDLPILMFSSDGSGGTGFSKAHWQEMQKTFAEENNAHLIYLECGHYVHDYEYNRIASEIESFIH